MTKSFQRGVVMPGASRKKQSTAKPKAKRAAKKGAPPPKGKTAADMIDQRIDELGGWRGKTLAQIRKLIKQADPDIVEEWKWSVPVWSHAGIVCTGEAYKAAVKTTFAKGASVPDPSGLFNSSLEGATRRAIDFHEGAKLDEKAFKALVCAAVDLNVSSGRGKGR